MLDLASRKAMAITASLATCWTMSGCSAKWGAHQGAHHGLPQLAAPGQPIIRAGK